MANQQTTKLVWQRCRFGCVRVDDQGRWWLLNHRETGWSSFGFCGQSQTNLEAKHHIRVALDAREDAEGVYYEFEKNLSSDHWSC